MGAFRAEFLLVYCIVVLACLLHCHACLFIALSCLLVFLQRCKVDTTLTRFSVPETRWLSGNTTGQRGRGARARAAAERTVRQREEASSKIRSRRNGRAVRAARRIARRSSQKETNTGSSGGANQKAEAYREYSVRHLSTDKGARGGESGGKKTPDVPFNPGGAAANEIQRWQHHSGAFSGTEFWRIWMVPWHGLGSTKTAHSAGPF